MNNVYLEFDVESIRIGYSPFLEYPAFDLLSALRSLSIAEPIIESWVPMEAARLAKHYEKAMLASDRYDVPFGWQLDTPTANELEALFAGNIGKRWAVRTD